MQGSRILTGKLAPWRSLGSILLFAVALHAQIADFSAEKLTFTVNAKYVEMTGSYFFSNRTGQTVRLPIIYPFCVNALQAFPDSVSV
ncbi:MAG: hypothetical protein V1681_04265, partial [Candidatus Neomarinimicrobiota bacterium]